MTRIAEQTQNLSNKAPGTENEDLLLMRRIAGKDRKAFEELYYRYAPRTGKYLMKLLYCRELVDEAMNDVMLAVWQNAERFDPDLGRLSTWLFGIAHNKGLKLLERQRRHRIEDALEAGTSRIVENEQDESAVFPELSDSDNPEQTVLGWEIGDLLLWALEQLTAEHRAVVELTFAEHCSYQEIAVITGCPVNTVKTRMFHARKKLAELLALRGYSFGS